MEPAGVYYSSVYGEQPKTQNDETPVRVTEAFPDNPALKVTIQKQAAGKSYLVGVSVPQNFTPASGEGGTAKDRQTPHFRLA